MRNHDAEALTHCLKRQAFQRDSRSTEIARHNTKGLTMIELLVSLVLISFAIIAASSLISYGIFGLRKTEDNYDTQNLIDRNLSMIESMADRYACVDGTCTVQSSVPAKDEYIDPSDSSDWDDFKNRCEATQLTTTPSDLISPLANYIATNLPAPAGLHRDLKVHGDGSDMGIGRIRHMTVQYRLGNSDGPLIRNSMIIPTITSYCP